MGIRFPVLVRQGCCRVTNQSTLGQAWSKEGHLSSRGAEQGCRFHLALCFSPPGSVSLSLVSHGVSVPGTVSSLQDRDCSPGAPGLDLTLFLCTWLGPSLREVLMDQAWHRKDFGFACFQWFLEALIK